jgi:hypothetical protein
MKCFKKIVVGEAFCDLTTKLYLVTWFNSLWQKLISMQYYVGGLRILILSGIHFHHDEYLALRYFLGVYKVSLEIPVAQLSILLELIFSVMFVVQDSCLARVAS